MALTVEDGTGLVDADSYTSLAFADQYHDDFGNDDWASATIEDREEALRVGTRDLDLLYGLRWKGTRKTQYQALDWPRTGVYDWDGYLVPDTEIPIDLQRATAELGLRWIQGVTMIPDVPGDSTGLKRHKVKAGPVEEEKEWFGPAVPSDITISPTVENYVRQYLEYTQLLERS